MPTYYVFLNYGYTNQVELFQSSSLSECDQIALEEAEEMDSDDILEVASFTSEGEYITHTVFRD